MQIFSAPSKHVICLIHICIYIYSVLHKHTHTVGSLWNSNFQLLYIHFFFCGLQVSFYLFADCWSHTVKLQTNSMFSDVGFGLEYRVDRPYIFYLLFPCLLKSAHLTNSVQYIYCIYLKICCYGRLK